MIFRNQKNLKFERRYVLITQTETHNLELSINLNLASKQNNVHYERNAGTLRIFCALFYVYLANHKSSKDFLSIGKFNSKHLSAKTYVVSFTYHDIKKEAIIKLLAYDLINYALSKHDEDSLKGAEISQEDANTLFDKLIMHYALQTTLENDLKKNDTAHEKKPKI